MSVLGDRGSLMSNDKMELRAVSFVLCEKDDPIFAENNFTFQICDEAAGEYVSIKSLNDDNLNGEITIGPETVDIFCDTLQLVKNACRKENK